MCLAKPGPRCSHHAAAAVTRTTLALADAEAALHDAVADAASRPRSSGPDPEIVKAENGLAAARERHAQALEDFKETPAYIKAVRRRAKDAGKGSGSFASEHWQAEADRAQALRDRKLAAYKAQAAGKADGSDGEQKPAAVDLSMALAYTGVSGQRVSAAQRAQDRAIAQVASDTWNRIEGGQWQHRADVEEIMQAWEDNPGPIVSRLPLVEGHGRDYAESILREFRAQRDADRPDAAAVEHYAAELGGVLASRRGRADDADAFALAGQIASRHSGMRVTVSRAMRGFGQIRAVADPAAVSA